MRKPEGQPQQPQFRVVTFGGWYRAQIMQEDGTWEDIDRDGDPSCCRRRCDCVEACLRRIALYLASHGDEGLWTKVSDEAIAMARRNR